MSKLFEPLQIGIMQLGHRLAMAPLTRHRADDDWLPTPMAIEYYEQRASTPGTLLISEGTLISKRAAGRRNVPGIWSDKQIIAWKAITDAVHARGCFIYCQLWDQGRAAMPESLARLGYKVKSSSAVRIDENRPIPEEMTEIEILEAILDFATAAKNAVEMAGFDGVEIHGANGYLLDQFLQDTCNKRTDAWGGSIEKRARFHVEVTRAVIAAVGAERTALRLSPFSDFLGMLMDDPAPTFSYLLEQLKPLNLSYLHLIEARISGNDDASCGGDRNVGFLVRQWNNASPVLLAGGFKADSARLVVDETFQDYDVVIVFGRYFISNPDLVFRVEKSIELDKYDRAHFYTPKSAKGYADYPFSQQYLDEKNKT